jgi:hypothetical protein
VDFPEPREEWLRYVVARRADGGGVETETRPVVFTRRAPAAPVRSVA